MIRHIVLVKFRDDVSDAVKENIFSQLEELKTQVDGISDFQSGLNVSPEGELTRGYKDLFWVDFESTGARDDYLQHPAHVVAGRRLVEHLEGGRDGIVVADLSI